VVLTGGGKVSRSLCGLVSFPGAVPLVVFGSVSASSARATAARVAGVFVAGGLGGAALDQVHIGGHVLEYAHPGFALQPLWVAPQFGVGALLVLLAAGPLAARAARTAPIVPTAELVRDAGWFVGAYLATALFDPFPGALALVLVATWAARAARGSDRVGRAAFAIGLAVVGTIYEGTLAGTGAFSYLRPDLYNVPIWLPGLYVHGAPLAISIRRLVWPPASRDDAPTTHASTQGSAAS
jgi:hypothetical protein